MKKNLLILFSAVTIGLLSSCNYFTKGYEYGNTVKEFMTGLMQKDYAKSISTMQLSTKPQTKTYMDTIKQGLDYFHDKIARKYGVDLNYSFLRTQQQSSLSYQPIPNTTTVLVQLSNDKNIGVVEALFDNKSGKIVSIKSLDINEPIPDMTKLWLFGIFSICIAAFNIYMLIRVYRSDMTYKWVKYLAIILLNIFAIGYSPAQGLIFRFVSIQYMLGIHFIKMGYLGTTWVFGIPVAGMYILWQLLSGKYTRDEKAKLKAQSTQIKGKRFKGKS